MEYKFPSPNRSYLFLAILVILIAGTLAIIRFTFIESLDQWIVIVISIVSLIISAGGLIISRLQLIRARQIQEAVNIKDFLTEFQKNESSRDAYHDLVYCYIDDVYEAVEAVAQEYMKQNNNSRPLDKIKPVFDCFEHLQKNNEPGRRFYHPLFFQFSPEEKKLDCLLDYFNAVGFYLYKKQVQMEDVVALLGDYLAVLADRKIITTYLKLGNDPNQWKYDDTVGATTPFSHLSYLIESYKEYNSQECKKKRDAMLQRAIKQLEEKKEEKKDD
jgi:hypothetical protein